MLASVASGTTKISNFAPGRDCASTLDCLRAAGVGIQRSGDELLVQGGLQETDKPLLLDCGNSGTTIRLLAGLFAGQGIGCELSGDDSLRRRPMDRVVEPLQRMGAEINSNAGRPPLKIAGGKELRGSRYVLLVASAQVKSAILLAGLNANGTTTVVERTQTRDHTERMLAAFGVTVATNDNAEGEEISLEGGQRPIATRVDVPGDISSAAFFLVGAAMMRGSDLMIENVGLNTTRTAVLDILRAYGAFIEIGNERISGGEPYGDIHIVSTAGLSRPAGFVIEGDAAAKLIDEIPVLAVMGAHAAGGLEVRGAGELRQKEADRIAAITANLTRMGAKVAEYADGFAVMPSVLSGAEIESFGDHRIAMAFAVAALAAEGATIIADAECVGISYPGFFEDLGAVSID